ncbi:hypothetical protein BDR03DRAFT_202438 [Suillus americanus]|nr:hypothetical protein BDR03DRAFT_202438 [Suillus americanus]
MSFSSNQSTSPMIMLPYTLPSTRFSIILLNSYLIAPFPFTYSLSTPFSKLRAFTYADMHNKIQESGRGADQIALAITLGYIPRTRS